MIKTTLRAKHQITLPKKIVKRLNLREGDELIVGIEEGRATLRPAKATYRGTLKREFRTHADVSDFLRAEREAWADRT